MDIQTLAHDLGKSVSTLKRWKKQIEHLAEYEFEKKQSKSEEIRFKKSLTSIQKK